MKPISTVLPGLALTLVMMLQACGNDKAQGGASSMATIQLEAYYRERILLPPDARLRVTLSDVSKMDVAAELITEVIIDDPGAPPYSVTLQYDPAVIEQRNSYAIRATIKRNDKLMFTSTEHIDAFTPDDNGVVRVLMQGVPGRN